MIWQELEKSESENAYNDYCISRKINCPYDYKELRDEIKDLFLNTLSEINITPEDISKKNYSYQVDYRFGMKLYLLLNNKYEMNVRLAASAGIWRFLGLYIIPDIVEMRCGINHPDKFWKKPKRIWLSTLWWYIYLSWQGNEVETIAIINQNSTDEILQLIDRCGHGGYRVDLCREFMKQYGLMDPSERRKKDIFRKMLVLNTARVQVVEPGLVEGGEKQYVMDLCEYFLDV